MSDPIERTDAIEAVEFGITYAKMIDTDGWTKPLFENENRELKKAIERIKDIPSAEKHGEWIDKGWHGDWQFETDGRGNCWHEYECSECGFHSKGSKSNYCPNCGCRMKGTKIVGKHADQMIIDEACMKGADDEKGY